MSDIVAYAWNDADVFAAQQSGQMVGNALQIGGQTVYPIYGHSQSAGGPVSTGELTGDVPPAPLISVAQPLGERLQRRPLPRAAGTSERRTQRAGEVAQPIDDRSTLSRVKDSIGNFKKRCKQRRQASQRAPWTRAPMDEMGYFRFPVVTHYELSLNTKTRILKSDSMRVGFIISLTPSLSPITNTTINTSGGDIFGFVFDATNNATGTDNTITQLNAATFNQSGSSSSTSGRAHYVALYPNVNVALVPPNPTTCPFCVPGLTLSEAEPNFRILQQDWGILSQMEWFAAAEGGNTNILCITVLELILKEWPEQCPPKQRPSTID